MMTHSLTNLPQISEHKSGWPWSESMLPITADQSSVLPKISVITFTHNQAEFLEATIRSVLLQGYPNLEYIVVDGSSTDGTQDIIQKYSQWITYWESIQDPAHALVDAFRKASGDIVAWLNSGDLYAPDALFIAAKRLNNADLGLLVGSIIYTRTSGTLDGDIGSQWPSWEKMSYEADVFPQASVFWTRDLWDAASANLSVHPDFALDYYLSLQMFYYARTFIPEAIVLSYSTMQSQWHDEHQAYAALAAVKQRGEKPLVWLVRLWLYRIRLALWKRKWKMLTGSRFHQIATQLILSPQRQTERAKSLR